MSLHASLPLLDTELPEGLSEKILAYVSRCAPSFLVQGREALTARYRPLAHTETAQGEIGVLTPSEQAAYLLTRLPATYAVVKAILHHARQIVPEVCDGLKSLLDLGGGPGTVLWSVQDALPHLKQATVWEQHLSWITMAKQLASGTSSALLQGATWQQVDLRFASSMPCSDLVVCSYVLGELLPECLLQVIERAWEATGQLLLIVEPGTPAGFERIRLVRDALLKAGAHIVAPCTHAQRCPMEGSNWCHFGQKVMRTQLHRRLKGAHLGYEEEKYSYLIVSKRPIVVANTPYSRLLRPPRKRSKHLHLTLCSPSGLTHPVISARTPELYQLGKEAEWGDGFPLI